MFYEQFAFESRALVNFVGAGGKTGLILNLLGEFSQSAPVIYTTTTRIHPPQVEAGMTLIGCDDPGLLKVLVERAARQCGSRIRKFVLTKGSMTPNLLRGVEPHFAQTLDRHLFPIILNEADGAASMSIKLPREGEPVLMDGANYLVPVIGLDCLMKPMGPETIFRWDLGADRFALKRGEILTPELAAAILLHPNGVCKDWQRGMRIIAYINMVDDPAQDVLARDLARILLASSDFPVERVVWGSIYTGRAASIS